MKRGLITTAFILLFSCKLIYSQDLDSLRNIGTVNSFIKIGQLQSNRYGYTDSLYVYAQRALVLAKKTKDKIGEQKALLNIAIYYQKQNDFDTSTLILKTLTEPYLQPEVKFNIGLNSFRKNDNKEALEFYLKSVEGYEKQLDNDGIALCYMRMAGLFVNEGQVNEAINYGQKAEAMLPKMKDVYSKLTVLSGLSGLCIQIGINKTEYRDTAIIYAKKALDLVEPYKYYNKWGQLSNSLSNIYYLRGDYQTALNYSKQSLKFRNYLFPNEILISYLNLSDCYSGLKQHKQSLAYLDSVRIVLNSIRDPYYFMALFERIYAYNKEEGNYFIALSGLERFKAIQDSLFNFDKSKAINELEQKYNRSENEKKINELNKENEIASLNVKFMAVGILALVLSIIAIVFFYRQSVLKNKFRSLEIEQRLNRARINPHFFFNVLASIQTLSIDKENSGQVSILISQFSKIMRQSLESTYDELSTIEKEIEFLENYLNIQKTRFPKKFDYKMEVDDNLEINEVKILGMLLQPFVENSIEHGFNGIDHKGQIEIKFLKENNVLKVTLKDNGNGLRPGSKEKTHTSRATQIIKDRLMLLNKKYNANSSFELKENTDRGISIVIRLPIIY